MWLVDSASTSSVDRAVALARRGLALASSPRVLLERLIDLALVAQHVAEAIVVLGAAEQDSRSFGASVAQRVELLSAPACTSGGAVSTLPRCWWICADLAVELRDHPAQRSERRGASCRRRSARRASSRASRPRLERVIGLARARARRARQLDRLGHPVVVLGAACRRASSTARRSSRGISAPRPASRSSRPMPAELRLDVA